MAVMNGGSPEKPNGGVFQSPPPSVVDNEKEQSSTTALLPAKGGVSRELGEDVNLSDAFNHLMGSIFDPDPDKNSSAARPPVANRIKKSFMEAAPMFREAIPNTSREVLQWTRCGSPLRALLVLSAGIVTLLALTGMLVFMLFFVVATVNAIAISFLISLAAIGGFLAIFFSCLTAFYIGMLFIAAIVTFTITISSILAALFASGWIGFIWITWLALSKSASLAKSMAGKANAANVSGQQKSASFKEP